MAFIFDVAELAPGMGKSMGIYNYARRLFRALLPLLGPDEIMHVTCNAGCAPDFDPAGDTRVRRHIVIDEVQPSTFSRQMWMRWGAQRFARKLGVAVYFSPKGFLPGWFGRSKGLHTVAVLHDLIPLWYDEHYPGYFGRLEQWVVTADLRRTALCADELVLISQATANDVQRSFDRPAGHSHVIYNGVPWVRPRLERPVQEPYIMAISSSLPHKNAVGLLSAYALYRATTSEPLPLFVFGIKDPGQPGVTAIQGADDITLHTYYAHASLFVFLSLIEGFGFPPIEAMSHGTAVLCSDIDSLREVTAGEASLVSPGDAGAVAQAMSAALARQPKERQVSLEQDPAWRARFAWETCAQRVLGVIHQSVLRA
jgi:glycosyltransferase involved in cell wall biosynthesis